MDGEGVGPVPEQDERHIVRERRARAVAVARFGSMIGPFVLKRMGTEARAGSRSGITATILTEVTGMRITSKGQVTIPLAIRRRAGLLPNTEVTFTMSRGRRLVDHMKGKATTRLTTDEILAMTRRA
jgi:hypothetical protein